MHLVICNIFCCVASLTNRLKIIFIPFSNNTIPNYGALNALFMPKTYLGSFLALFELSKEVLTKVLPLCMMTESDFKHKPATMVLVENGAAHQCTTFAETYIFSQLTSLSFILGT